MAINKKTRERPTKKIDKYVKKMIKGIDKHLKKYKNRKMSLEELDKLCGIE